LELYALGVHNIYISEVVTNLGMHKGLHTQLLQILNMYSVVHLSKDKIFHRDSPRKRNSI
jgi:hypothetical protein